MERSVLIRAGKGDAEGHPLKNNTGRKGIGNSRGWAFWVAALALVFFLAPSQGLCDTAEYPYRGKGLYFAGYPHFFMHRIFTKHELVYHRASFSDPDSSNVWHYWKDLKIAGSLGACTFNGKIYCFFMTLDQKVQYVTVNPSDSTNYDYKGPFLMTTLSYSGDVYGVAASVMGGTLYVFTPTATFSSKDGTDFRQAFPGPSTGPVEVLDAVTFYPPGEDDPGIMVVVDSAHPQSWVFRNDPDEPWSDHKTLTYPHTDPILGGNLLLGSANCNSGDPCYNLKNPAIQFYGVRKAGSDGTNHPLRWQYDLGGEDGWLACTTLLEDFKHYSSNGFNQVIAMPAAMTADPYVFMFHFLWYYNEFIIDDPFLGSYSSDILIAQNHDPGTYGWQGTPTVTANAADGSDLQKLWTLVGVVLGPPPFSLNGCTDPNECPNWEGISQVEYGKDQSTSISTQVSSTNITTVAVGGTVKAGMGEFSMDVSYSHAVTKGSENTSSKEVTSVWNFGPLDEDFTDAGTHGWGIFSLPTLVTQRYRVHSWNSTDLDQDIYYTTLGATVLKSVPFLLNPPKGKTNEGLFTGMNNFWNSTDLEGWLNATNWDQLTSCTVKFGDATNPQVPPLTLGTNTTQTYVENNTKVNVNSESNTNSVSISAGASMDFLGGFSATVSHESEFTTSTELTCSITQSVSSSLLMKIPQTDPPPGTITSLTVQPYWLQATNDQAPWIPAGYSGNLPWCITWGVPSYTEQGGSTAGVALSPDWAWGSIRHTAVKNKCMYLLVGGALSWRNSDGTETPISMTATEFDPALGAKVSLSGYPFKADGSTGDWTRYGDIWEYRTEDGATDSFELELDFGRREWSFYGSTAVPDGNVLVGNGSLNVQLNLQGSYLFKNQLNHRVKTTWSHKEDEADWKSFGVHYMEGDYDSEKGTGHLTLVGHILEDIPMGDMQILVNGVPVSFPFLRTEGFLDKVEKNETVTLEGEGATMKMDFGAKRWTAFIDEKIFQGGMTPRGGTTRVQVLVGGEPISDQRLPIFQHTTALSYGG